ncbi:prolyl oligopeptidase family serine peptidase, partial [bacterium]|nr:prolyl oligopeptidase family serine peptidase [bacterium]
MVEHHAQGAKIHRKYAHLSVHPEVVFQDAQVVATVHIFERDYRYRIGLYHGVKELISQHLVMCAGAVCTQILPLPENVKGKVLVVLEVEKGGYWSPVAEETVYALPGFFGEIQQAKRRAEKVEEQAASDDNSPLLRGAWAVLAYIEDLLERAKFGGMQKPFILEQKLSALQSKVGKLEAGQNPYADVTGYQLRGYRSDMNGEIQLYSLYVPKKYDASQPWPFAVMLHGAWSNHHLAMRRIMGKSNQTGESDAEAKRTMPSLPDVPYLVACPNGFETLSYEGFAGEDVWRVMHEVEEEFHVDPDRVYMTGLSMGGAGTAKLAFRKPDKFAALAMVCGFFDPLTIDPHFFDKPLFSRRLEDVAASHPISDNIYHVPIKLFHGEKDTLVPPEGSKKLHGRLTKIGFQSEIELYPDVGHEAWENAYKDARIFDWFAQFTRVKTPREIRYKCGDAEGGGAYWLHVDELKDVRRYGTVKVLANEDHIFVDSKNVQRLTLTVPQELYPNRDILRIRINKSDAYDGPFPQSPLSFAAHGRDFRLTDKPLKPKRLPGRWGIDTVFDDRHIYVYQSSGAEEECREAQKLAVQRSLPDSWADVRWDVLPEQALT